MLAALERVCVARALISDCLDEKEILECGSHWYLQAQSTEYSVGFYMLEYLADLIEDEQPSCDQVRRDIRYFSGYRRNLTNPNADFVFRLAEKVCRLESAWPLERTKCCLS